MTDTALENSGVVSDEQTDQREAPAKKAAFFSDLEARVIGVLMEKLLATPNNYPLTMNSLTLGCNQKSNREPVMNLTEGQVGRTVNQLDERHLVRIEYGERANKVSHRAANKLDINREQQALLSVMLLRGAQTLNELKTRTARMASFESPDALITALNGMIERDEPLVVKIPKGHGRREDRYMHTLRGEVDFDAVVESAPSAKSVESDALERIAALEARVAALEEALGMSAEDVTAPSD